MKFSKTRSCVARNSVPAAQNACKRIIASGKVPLLLLQVNNIQRRSYESTMEVKIDDCITAKDLMNAIEVQKNLSVLELLFRGVRLSDTYELKKLLPDFRVGPPRFAVHTRIRPHAIPGGVTINVREFDGGILPISLHSLDTTVLEFKEIVASKMDIFIDHMVLIYERQHLCCRDDHDTLRECNLEPGCMVDQNFGHITGGGAVFVDVGETQLLQKFRLEPNRAPRWRVSEEGLSVEGKCLNEDCEAHDQMVICNLKFKVFNFQTDAVGCPLCREAFIPVTCGFRKCLWMFEGRKEGRCGLDMASVWMKAGKCYERFDESTEQSTATWSTLIITAKQLPSRRRFSDTDDDRDCQLCHESLDAPSSQCTLNGTLNCKHAFHHKCVLALRCKHAFHRECVLAWQRRGHSSSMCRESME